MLRKLLRYLAKKSHNVQTQLICATLYGLVDIFGIGGTIAIIMKSRKIAKPSNRVTVKPRKVE